MMYVMMMMMMVMNRQSKVSLLQTRYKSRQQAEIETENKQRYL